MLARLGATVIDADDISHRVMERGTDVWRRIVIEFGSSILDGEGHISRPRLGMLVFADAAALARLEAIVHPAVLAEIDGMLGRLADELQGQIPVVVIEAIKLIESGLGDRCDEIWVVTAPREQQVERLQRTRGLALEQAVLRVDAQPPQEAKAARADTVITNEGTLEELHAQVVQQWERVVSIVWGG